MTTADLLTLLAGVWEELRDSVSETIPVGEFTSVIQCGWTPTDRMERVLAAVEAKPQGTWTGASIEGKTYYDVYFVGADGPHHGIVRSDEGLRGLEALVTACCRALGLV